MLWIFLLCWAMLTPAARVAAWRVASRRAVVAGGLGALSTRAASRAAAAAEPQKLTFQETPSGVRIADIDIGTKGEAVVESESRVTVNLVGRLAGKQGWVFEDSKKDDDPYRLQLGKGKVVAGLEEGLQGMRVGGRRRIVVPSSLGYQNRVY